MSAAVTLGPAYFDEMYASGSDPWGFESRWYEQRKYAITVAQLPAERYRAAFEPGCSIGVLTRMLAARCDSLLASDLAPAAVEQAARRTSDLPRVRVEQRAIPRDWPAGRFDLIVFSEVLYYLGDADLRQALGSATAALEPGGTLLAVHWRHPVAEYPRTGDDVHEALGRQDGLARLVSHREPDFVAETYLRTDGEPVSVARAAGLV